MRTFVKYALYTIALVCELTGLGLVGFRETGHYAARVRHRVGRGRQWAASQFRRVFRGGRRDVTINVPVAIATAMALGVAVIRGVPDRTLAEKVEGLVEHDRDSQTRLGALEQTSADEAAAGERESAKLRADLERRAIDAAEAVVDRGQGRRALGMVFIAVGAIAGTIGNMIPA